MTITTIEQAIIGVKPVEYFHKVVSGTLVAGRPFCPLMFAGIPGAATVPSPGVAGATLDRTLSGCLPFPTTQAGQSIRLANFIASTSANTGVLMLVDFLWWNSGLSLTLTTSQTVNSVTWPARDDNELSDGTGVYIGLFITTGTGAGTPNLTLTYTNQAGTAGRTANLIQATAASSALGTFYQFALQAGDTGVRSVQSYQASATWTSGVVHLVAYRILATLDILSSGQPEALNLLTGGAPKVWNATCPNLLYIPATTTTTSIYGSVTWTQA